MTEAAALPPAIRLSYPELVVRFAVTVADLRRDAMLIGPDNRKLETGSIHPWGTVESVAQSGRPFCVVTAPHIIALDIDSPHTSAWGRDVRAQVESKGWAVVEVTSGGARGGRHVFFSLSVGWDHQEANELLAQLGVGV